MQNLFINPNDEFIIKFSVAIDKDDTIFCDLLRENLISRLEAMDRKVDDFTIEDYSAVFKKPSFGDSTTLYSEILSLSDSGMQFNPVKARYNKMTALIKSWDLKGEENKPTEEEIKKLHPVIANVIGIQIDLIIGGIFG